MDLTQFETIKGMVKKLLGDDEDSKSYNQTKFVERMNDEGIHCIRIAKQWNSSVYGSTSMLRDVESYIDRNESKKAKQELMKEAKASESAVKDLLLQYGLFPITDLVLDSSLHSNPMVHGKAQKVRKYQVRLWIYAYEKLSLEVAKDSCIYVKEGKEPKILNAVVGVLKGTDIKVRMSRDCFYFKDEKYDHWYKIPKGLFKYYVDRDWQKK